MFKHALSGARVVVLQGTHLGAHVLCANDGLQLPGGFFRWRGGSRAVGGVGMPCTLGGALRILFWRHGLCRSICLRYARRAVHLHGDCLALHLQTMLTP